MFALARLSYDRRLPRIAILSLAALWVTASHSNGAEPAPRLDQAESVTLPAGTVSLQSAIDQLNGHNNQLLLELGVNQRQHLDLRSAFRGSWWQAVEYIAQQGDLGITPQPSLSPWSWSTEPHAAGELQQRLAPGDDQQRLHIYHRGVALTKQRQPPLSVAHHQSWRLEVLTAVPFQSAMLSGSQQWVAVDLRVLGEPRLRKHDHLHAEFTWQQVVNQEGHKRSFEQPAIADNLQAVTQQNTARTDADAQSPYQHRVVVGECGINDETLHLSGVMAVTAQQSWQRQGELTADQWHTFDLPSGHQLQVAIVVAAEERLKEERQLANLNPQTVVVIVQGESPLPRPPAVAIKGALLLKQSIRHSNAPSGGTRVLTVWRRDHPFRAERAYHVTLQGLANTARSEFPVALEVPITW